MAIPAVNNSCPPNLGEPKICKYYAIHKDSPIPADTRLSVVALDFLNKNLPKVCGPCNNPKPSDSLPSDPHYASLVNSIENYINNYEPTEGSSYAYPRINEFVYVNGIPNPLLLDYFSITNSERVIVAWPVEPAFSTFDYNGATYNLGFIRGTWGPGKPYQYAYDDTDNQPCTYTSIFELKLEGGNNDGDYPSSYKFLNKNPTSCTQEPTGGQKCSQEGSHFSNSRCICTGNLNEWDGYLESMWRSSLGKDTVICDYRNEEDMPVGVGENRPERCDSFNGISCDAYHGWWPWWSNPLSDNTSIRPYKKLASNPEEQDRFISAAYRATRSKELFKATRNPENGSVAMPRGLPNINNAPLSLTNSRTPASDFFRAYEKWVETNWEFMSNDWKEAVVAVYGVVEPEELNSSLEGTDTNGEPREIYLELWGLDLNTKKMVKKVDPVYREDQSNIIRNYLYVTGPHPVAVVNRNDLYIGFNRLTCELEEHIVEPGQQPPCMESFVPTSDAMIPDLCPMIHVRTINNFDGILLSEKDPGGFAKLQIEYQNKFQTCKKACCVNIKAKKDWNWNSINRNTEWTPIKAGEERTVCVLSGETACDPKYITSRLLLGPNANIVTFNESKDFSGYYRFDYKTNQIYKDCGDFPIDAKTIQDLAFGRPPVEYERYRLCEIIDSNRQYERVDTPFEILSTTWNNSEDSCTDFDCPAPPTDNTKLGTCCYVASTPCEDPNVICPQVMTSKCAVTTQSKCEILRGFWEAASGNNPASCTERGPSLISLADGTTIVATLGPRNCSVLEPVDDSGLLPPVIDPPVIKRPNINPPKWFGAGPDSNPFYQPKSIVTTDDNRIFMCIGTGEVCSNTSPLTPPIVINASVTNSTILSVPNVGPLEVGMGVKGVGVEPNTVISGINAETNTVILDRPLAVDDTTSTIVLTFAAWSPVSLLSENTHGACCYPKLLDEVNSDRLSRSQVRSANKTYKLISKTGYVTNIDIKLSLLNDGSIIKLTFPSIEILDMIYPPQGSNGINRETLIENNFRITDNSWKITVSKIENNSVILTTVPTTP